VIEFDEEEILFATFKMQSLRVVKIIKKKNNGVLEWNFLESSEVK